MRSSGAIGSGAGPLRVLHVTETLPGGIATYLSELLPLHMADPAIGDIRVLAPRDQLAHLKNLPEVMLHGYPRSGRNLRSLWNLAMALRRQVLEFRPHIVHLHSSFAGAVGRLLRPWFPSGIRIVYCPHGWAFLRDDNNLVRRAYILAERFLASRADALLAISEHERAQAEAAGIGTLRMRLIYNGVGDTRERQIALLPALDPDFLNLLFVGRHDRQKGLDVLLSAMGHLTEQKIRLYVAGAGIVGGDSEKENSDNIFWLGWLSGDELIAYYRACDAVVMPSRWEGMPLVALEAMREGKPVLAARREPLPEVVADGGILFEPESAAALATTLRTLDSSELIRLGDKARIRYQSCFQSQRMGDELRTLYQELHAGSQKFN